MLKSREAFVHGPTLRSRHLPNFKRQRKESVCGGSGTPERMYDHEIVVEHCEPSRARNRESRKTGRRFLAWFTSTTRSTPLLVRVFGSSCRPIPSVLVTPRGLGRNREIIVRVEVLIENQPMNKFESSMWFTNGC